MKDAAQEPAMVQVICEGCAHKAAASNTAYVSVRSKGRTAKRLLCAACQLKAKAARVYGSYVAVSWQPNRAQRRGKQRAA